MVNRVILLWIVIAFLCDSEVQCKGGGRGGGRRGGGKGGRRSGGTKSRSHTYDKSSSGLSGSGSHHDSSGYPGVHSYPSSRGLSGTGNYHSPYHPKVYARHPVPSYYTSPQYAYIKEYRNSESRYGSLLIGLTMYNLGRSHGHYNHHYYYDDHYRRRYDSPNTTTTIPKIKPPDAANCTLTIKDKERLEVLNIPCDIVSTFTEGSKTDTSQNYVNETVCVTTPTVMNNTDSESTELKSMFSMLIPDLSTRFDSILKNYNIPITTPNFNLDQTHESSIYGLNTSAPLIPLNISSNTPADVEPLYTPSNTNESVSRISESSNMLVSESDTSLNISSDISSEEIQVTNETIVNVTTCTTTRIYNFTKIDPLETKGPAVNSTNMECSVDIETKESLLRNTVDCKLLLRYAKMPEPNYHIDMLPPRYMLKTWLEQPPWWMSMFIAV